MKKIKTKTIKLKPGEVIQGTDFHQNRLYHCLRGQGFSILNQTQNEFKVGDTFTVLAGSKFILECTYDLDIIVVNIPVNKVICRCFSIGYDKIKKAIDEGATTVDDIKIKTQASSACHGCSKKINDILKSVTKL